MKITDNTKIWVLWIIIYLSIVLAGKFEWWGFILSVVIGFVIYRSLFNYWFDK